MLNQDAFPGQGRPRDEEMAALKCELVQAKKERDFRNGSGCVLVLRMLML